MIDEIFYDAQFQGYQLSNKKIYIEIYFDISITFPDSPRNKMIISDPKRKFSSLRPIPIFLLGISSLYLF